MLNKISNMIKLFLFNIVNILCLSLKVIYGDLLVKITYLLLKNI